MEEVDKTPTTPPHLGNASTFDHDTQYIRGRRPSPFLFCLRKEFLEILSGSTHRHVKKFHLLFELPWRITFHLEVHRFLSSWSSPGPHISFFRKSSFRDAG
jgi:hypothetical protein